MHIISKHPKLSQFWTEHPEAKTPLLAWHKLVEHATWGNFADVRRDYASADAVAGFVVFNIGGNKYRLVVRIVYKTGKIYVHRVMTHKEYDRGDWKKD